MKKYEGDSIATGHYVQNDKFHLLKGKDFAKDQSYFLSLINGKKLEKSIFPIGNLMKTKVREIARIESLDMISEKKDSVGKKLKFYLKFHYQQRFVLHWKEKF